MRTLDCWTHQGLLKYVATLDEASGKSDRYTLAIHNTDDPVIVGREVTMDLVKELVGTFEEVAKDFPGYIGEREDIIRMVQIVTARRLHAMVGRFAHRRGRRRV